MGIASIVNNTIMSLLQHNGSVIVVLDFSVSVEFVGDKNPGAGVGADVGITVSGTRAHGSEFDTDNCDWKPLQKQQALFTSSWAQNACRDPPESPCCS